MNKYLRLKKNALSVALAVLLISAGAVPASAASKSATVQVSCTILPAIQLSSTSSLKTLKTGSTVYIPMASPTKNPNTLSLDTKKPLIYVNTNLGKKYSIIQTLLKYHGQMIRVYSVTAL